MLDFINPFATKPAAPAAPVSATPAAQAPATPVAPNPPGTDGSSVANNINVAPGITPVSSPGTDVNGVVPDNVNEAKSPLADFATLWENDPNNQAAPAFTPEAIDPAKLQEVISKVDLTTAVTADNLALIQQGGENATKALMDSLNHVAQQTLVQSTTVANKMLENNSTKLVESVMAQIPALLKEQNLTSELTQKNALFNDPAVKPVIDAVKSQLATKYPQATAPQLATMAQDFVTAMSGAFNPAPAAPGTQLPIEQDFSEFI